MVVLAAVSWRRSDAVVSRQSGGGEVDVGFLQHMAQHHDQAVVIANLVDEEASRPIRTLARQIVQEQLYEIGQMRGWLQLWGRDGIPASRSMDWITLKPGRAWTKDQAYAQLCSAQGSMPGFATTTDLNGLRDSSGRAAELLFLQLMLRHHLSAIPMARFAARNAETPLVAALAAGMVREQSEEAAAMRTMLPRYGGKELPFPDIDVHISVLIADQQ